MRMSLPASLYIMHPVDVLYTPRTFTHSPMSNGFVFEARRRLNIKVHFFPISPFTECLGTNVLGVEAEARHTVALLTSRVVFCAPQEIGTLAVVETVDLLVDLDHFSPIFPRVDLVEYLVSVEVERSPLHQILLLS